MKYSAIFAIDLNNILGVNNNIPWSIPEDMARFKELTTGNIVIMGRKTWESIPEKYRPLPDRLNIIISSTMERFDSPNIVIVNSVEEAVRMCEYLVGYDEAFFIGGAGILEASTQYVTKVYMTRVVSYPKEYDYDEYDNVVKFNPNTFFTKGSNTPFYKHGESYKFVDFNVIPHIKT